MSRPLKFAVVGCANTIAGLAVIYSGKFFLQLDDVTANICGYAAGLLLSFFLNGKWTFAYAGLYAPAFIRFLISFFISYSANLVIVLLLIEFASMNAYMAQAAGVVPYTITFYLLNRFVVFADRRHLT